LLEVSPYESATPTMRRRPVGDVLKDLLTVLAAGKVQYVLTGTVAYGLYARARYTTDIAAILSAGSWDAITKIARGVGFMLVRECHTKKAFFDTDSGVEFQVSSDWRSKIPVGTPYLVYASRLCGRNSSYGYTVALTTSKISLTRYVSRLSGPWTFRCCIKDYETPMTGPPLRKSIAFWRQYDKPGIRPTVRALKLD
jgi:hypothetical protein